MRPRWAAAPLDEPYRRRPSDLLRPHNGRAPMRLPKPHSILRRSACFGLAACLLLCGAARAAELRVVSSGGFAAAYRALAPEFERQTGHALLTEWGPTMGNAPNAMPQRLVRNEPIDVVIMVGYALGH